MWSSHSTIHTDNQPPKDSYQSRFMKKKKSRGYRAVLTRKDYQHETSLGLRRTWALFVVFSMIAGQSLTPPSPHTFHWLNTGMQEVLSRYKQHGNKSSIIYLHDTVSSSHLHEVWTFHSLWPPSLLLVSFLLGWAVDESHTWSALNTGARVCVFTTCTVAARILIHLTLVCERVDLYVASLPSFLILPPYIFTFVSPPPPTAFLTLLPR